MRYILQTDLFRCGPIGIANALRWAGSKFTWRDIRPSLDTLCGCDKENNCSSSFEEGLSAACHGILQGAVEPTIVTNDAYGDMVKMFDHVRAGGSALVLYFRIKTDGSRKSHVFFVPEVDEKEWTATCVNLHKDKKLETVHFNYLVYLAGPSTWGFSHKIWLLSKIEEERGERIRAASERISEFPVESFRNRIRSPGPVEPNELAA
jgi:hypothetical protein